ncbi:MAG: hypothetical protein D6769_02950 [Methanobacteriota archaeon]|nr:MAG: hypothetical protein D6769_02950 [Euryarchaeota archaeon]
MVKAEMYVPENKKKAGKGAGKFDEFIKQNEKEIEKLAKEFPKATKAGIKDLVFLIWQAEQVKGKKKIFTKARRLMKTLFKSSWVSMLSAFKLVGDIFKR